MKIVKWILIIIAIIIIVPVVTAAFMKRDYTLTQEVVINKPKQEVFDYVKFVKNQNKFSKWVLSDPQVKIEYRGTDGAVGFISAWDSQADAGKGEQEIKQITEGENVTSEVRFIKPFEGLAASSLATQATGEAQTKVTWTFSSSMPFPMNFMRLFSDKMLESDMQESLQTLKKQLEQ